MALNSTYFYPISPKSNRVAHPDSGMLGETLVVLVRYGISGSAVVYLLYLHARV